MLVENLSRGSNYIPAVLQNSPDSPAADSFFANDSFCLGRRRLLTGDRYGIIPYTIRNTRELYIPTRLKI
jgi:hypothetical protein